jgi:hypothetical protein
VRADGADGGVEVEEAGVVEVEACGHGTSVALGVDQIPGGPRKDSEESQLSDVHTSVT